MARVPDDPKNISAAESYNGENGAKAPRRANLLSTCLSILVLASVGLGAYYMDAFQTAPLTPFQEIASRLITYMACLGIVIAALGFTHLREGASPTLSKGGFPSGTAEFWARNSAQNAGARWPNLGERERSEFRGQFKRMDQPDRNDNDLGKGAAAIIAAIAAWIVGTLVLSGP
jgi:hypothetical protein